MANASCPTGSVGTATRACLGPKGPGWAAQPDLSGCLHKEFVLFNQLLKNQTNQESWVLAKKARELVDRRRTGSDLYQMDVGTVRAGVNAIFGRESDLSGFRLAHRVDRNFLDNFFNVISWLFDANSNSGKSYFYGRATMHLHSENI